MQIGMPIQIEDGSIVSVTGFEGDVIKYYDELNKRSGEINARDVKESILDLESMPTSIYIDGNYLNHCAWEKDLYIDYRKMKKFFEYYGGGPEHTRINFFGYHNPHFKTIQRLTYFLSMNGFQAKLTKGKYASYTDMVICATQDTLLRQDNNIVFITNDTPIKSYVDYVGDSARVFLISKHEADFPVSLLEKVSHTRVANLLPYFTRPIDKRD